MAHKMKAVAAPKVGEATLVIQVDPLAVARGHRVLPRGGLHESARRPSRSRGKGQWRRQLERDGRRCRGRDNPTGLLV